MLVTLVGIEMEARLLQSLKAELSMLSNFEFSEKVIEVRFLQPEKASLLMFITPSGMVMEVSLLQPSKARRPILVTLWGIIVVEVPLTNSFHLVFMMALQLSRESYTGFPLATVIEVGGSQIQKAILSIFTTLAGILREVRVLCQKARPSMLVTLYVTPL